MLRSGIRWLSFSAKRSNKVLPLTPEMKAQKAWSAGVGEGDESITKKLVGMTKNLQDADKNSMSIDKSFQRKFNFGSTYDPFDFSQNKVERENSLRRVFRQPEKSYTGKTDIFMELGIDPLDLYTMPELLSRFVTSTGQIMPRERTGCTGANQKKLAIAIKRARAAGLLSCVQKHTRFAKKRLL